MLDILGAGNGGYMVFFADPHYHNTIREALRGLINVPFKFDNTGSQIIFNDHDKKETTGWGEEKRL